MTDSPVFLVGAERSGTTLLRLMLDSHPDIAFRYESDFFVEFMPDANTWPDLPTYYEQLRLYRFARGCPRIDRSLDYPSLVRSFLEQKRVADGKSLCGAVVHHHFDRLLRIWPEARFIHIVRDGRDVARSCVQMGWHGNAWAAAERWVTAERLWDLVCDLVPKERRMELRYEDLIARPVDKLTAICRFFGTAYSPAMLTYPERSTYKLPNAKHAYQWRKRMSSRAVQYVEARCGNLLALRAYAPSGNPRIELSPIEIHALQIGDRLGIARARARDLGPRLWAESLIATRVPLRAWRESVTARVSAAQNAVLE